VSSSNLFFASMTAG